MFKHFANLQKEINPSELAHREIEVDPLDERYVRFKEPVLISEEEGSQRVEVYQIHKWSQLIQDEFSNGYVSIVYSVDKTESTAIHDFREGIALEKIAQDARVIAFSRSRNRAAMKRESRVGRVQEWIKKNPDLSFTRMQIHNTGFCLMGIHDFFVKYGWSGNSLRLGCVTDLFEAGDEYVRIVCHGLWKEFA